MASGEASCASFASCLSIIAGEKVTDAGAPHALIATIVSGLVLAFVLRRRRPPPAVSPLVGYLLAGMLVGPFTPGFVADARSPPARRDRRHPADVRRRAALLARDLLAVRAHRRARRDRCRSPSPPLLGARLALRLGLGAGSSSAWPSRSPAPWSCCARSRRRASSRPSAGASPSAGSSSRTSRWCSPSCSARPRARRRRRPAPARASRWSRSRHARQGRGLRCADAARRPPAVPWISTHVARRARASSSASPCSPSRSASPSARRSSSASRSRSAPSSPAWCSPNPSSASAPRRGAAAPRRLRRAVLRLRRHALRSGRARRAPLRRARRGGHHRARQVAGRLRHRAPFGHPVGTALTVSASLAQIGEFSFILAGLGVALRLLPEEGRDLILAGAAFDRAEPVMFASSSGGRGRASCGPGWWLCRRRWPPPQPPAHRRRPRRPGTRSRREPDLTITSLTDHDVLVGYGRVGGLVGAGAARRRPRPVFVLEERERGDRGRPPRRGGGGGRQRRGRREGLRTANLPAARRLFVTIPETFEAGAGDVSAPARRTRTWRSSPAPTLTPPWEHLTGLGADLIIMGEREIANRMIERVFAPPPERAPRAGQAAFAPGDTESAR